MSRVGKAAIQLDAKLDFQINYDELKISFGDKIISRKLSSGIECKLSEDKSKAHLTIIKNKPSSNEATPSRMYGTERSLLKAAVDGLISGHEIQLELIGVGYKAAVNQGFLILTLGHSHDIMYALNKEVSIVVEKSNLIIIRSSEKRLAGTIASEIIKFRPHEPYKGKGVKIKGAHYVRKEGKKK